MKNILSLHLPCYKLGKILRKYLFKASITPLINLNHRDVTSVLQTFCSWRTVSIHWYVENSIDFSIPGVLVRTVRFFCRKVLCSYLSYLSLTIKFERKMLILRLFLHPFHKQTSTYRKQRQKFIFRWNLTIKGSARWRGMNLS